MKLKILTLITLIFLGAVSVFLIIPMANYIITYEEWFSFMTLRDAVITLIIISMLLGVIFNGIIMVALKMKRL